MSLCRRTVEDRLRLERVPLACTFGSPLDLHVRQSLRLQGPVDLICVLLLTATKHSSCDEKLCVRTRISDMHCCAWNL